MKLFWSFHKKIELDPEAALFIPKCKEGSSSEKHVLFRKSFTNRNLTQRPAAADTEKHVRCQNIKCLYRTNPYLAIMMSLYFIQFVPQTSLFIVHPATSNP